MTISVIIHHQNGLEIQNCVQLAFCRPFADAGVVHECGHHNAGPVYAAFAVDDRHVVRVRVLVVLDLFADGAEPVQRRRQRVGPAELHNGTLWVGTAQVRPFLGQIEDL